jgi:hypothetical protein
MWKCVSVILMCVIVSMFFLTGKGFEYFVITDSVFTIQLIVNCCFCVNIKSLCCIQMDTFSVKR